VAYTITVERVGRAIAAERVARGIKQCKLAALSDIDPKRLRAIEKGDVEPSPELAERLLKVIRVLADG
jgi:transcriptional regulator with XRE-family HTH domain